MFTKGCPVLIVREASRGPIKTSRDGIVLQKILVPVDFSDCALEGARYASVFATAVGAELLLMHIVRPLSHQVTEGKGSPKHWSRELKDSVLDAEDKLDVLVNFLPLAGISAETEVEVGVPAEQLTRASARAEIDLVILSTHGYSGLRHAMLGSVAEELSREAGCPVLVLPSHLRPEINETAGG
ncbi:MAG: universal stress protein [Verrucomicrobiota bacterium]|nr:universal stress protein [Verrucomicrobiota bacterium]